MVAPATRQLEGSGTGVMPVNCTAGMKFEDPPL
jgi:hypothetical protein